MQKWTRRSRVVFFAAGVALAALIAGVALANGDRSLAVVSLVSIGGLAAVQAFGRWEWAVIQGGAADERQRSINAQAIQIAYFAVVTVAVVGFLTEVVRGEPGAFTIVGSVGGFTHMLAIAVLKRRR